MAYYISEQWFSCERGGHAIFLDLKRERYFALAPSETVQLHTILHAGHIDGEAAALAESLEREGLLTRTRVERSGAFQAMVDRATSTCFTDGDMQYRLSRGDLVSFISAWTRALILFKVTPLRIIARRVRKRKAKGQIAAMAADADEVSMRCRTFFQLHPIFTNFNESRLLRSLALVEYLSNYGIYPSWVFAVRVQPFDVRCWVQYDEMLLDDVPSTIESFTPIMAL